MDARIIYNQLAKAAQSNRDYYFFGKPSQVGVIEDLLSYFGLDYEITSHSETMHQAGLKTLRDFMTNHASDEQLKVIADAAGGEPLDLHMDSAALSAGKVFVSMPMNKEKCSQVDVIRAGTETSIKRSRNQPYYLDLDVHNQNIVVKMLDEIKACKFLVADLTSQNPGVYYEAGYAKALGKTVIFTCQEKDFETVHFDIKQTQIVIWNNQDDLAEKLYSQIIGSNLRGD